MPSTVGPKDNYFIKRGYRARTRPRYYSDDVTGIVFQPAVYPMLAILAAQFGCKGVIDLGCGVGDKLAELSLDFRTLGLDLGANLEKAREKRPDLEWAEWDLEAAEPLRLPGDWPTCLASSAAISSDVIEHLVNPTPLLGTIRELMEHCAFGVLSTPERDLRRGQGHAGPPPNEAHVREWTSAELVALLTDAGLSVVTTDVTYNNDRDFERCTQVVAIRGTAGTALTAAVVRSALRMAETRYEAQVANVVRHRLAKLRIVKLYPEEVTERQPFNRQTGGESALAVECENATSRTRLLFDGMELETHYGSPSLISAIVPSTLTAIVGDHVILLRDADRVSEPAVFPVRPR